MLNIRITVWRMWRQLSTQTSSNGNSSSGDGKDLQWERSLDTGHSGEQIALLLAEVTGAQEGSCQVAKQNGENDIEENT